MRTLKLSLVLVLGIFPVFSFAEGMSAAEQEKLAKAAQNPVASMISLPFQNNTNLNIGSNDETQNILNVQPVWPFQINDEWNVITRTIVPVTSTESRFQPWTVISPDILDTWTCPSAAASIVLSTSSA